MSKFDLITLKALSEATLRGDTIVVQFNSAIGDTEMCMDEGQKATILRCLPDRLNDKVFDIVFDMSQFDEHNDRFAQRSYFDKHGNPVLTAKEAGFWRPQEEWSFMEGDTIPYTIIQ